MDDLLRALSLLVSQRASSAIVEDIVLKALRYPHRERILTKLLPAGVRCATARKAVDIVIRQSGTETLLELICNSTNLTSRALEMAPEHVFLTPIRGSTRNKRH